MPNWEPGVLKQPSWLCKETYAAICRTHAQMCATCETGADLTVDHIVARRKGGTDDLSNLQILCRRHNSEKGIRADRRWDVRLYWDQPIQLNRLRTAHRIAGYDMIDGYASWFTRPFSQISRRLYTLAWVVGSGKTLAIPTLAFALNQITMRELGPVAPRIDRVLVLCKEIAMRSQLAVALGGNRQKESELTKYGVCSMAPRVREVVDGTPFRNLKICDQAHIVVACIQNLWEKNGEPPADLAQVLAYFPLIVIDEPHFAEEQALRIVDAAEASLVFGTTGTPIEASGSALQKYVLFSLYNYQDANLYDQSVKHISDQEEDYADIVQILGITEAEIQRAGSLKRVREPELEPDYDLNFLPVKHVAESVVEHIYLCDGIKSASLFDFEAAISKPIDASVNVTYPVHGMLKVNTVSAGEMLCQHVNDLFESDRQRFKRARGYHCEVVYADTQEFGRQIKGKPLGDNHPWMRCYMQNGKLDDMCSRVVVVVDMGREGWNNPFCGVVGLACKCRSVVETSQRAVGRQLRSVVQRSEEGGLHVAPRRLDMPRIITHTVFRNKAAIDDALDFTLNMGGWLEGMTTLDDLTRSAEVPAGGAETGTPTLSPTEKIEIAVQIGKSMLTGEPIDEPGLVRRIGGGSPGKQRAATNWLGKVASDPISAVQSLNFLFELSPRGFVVSEEIKDEPNEAQLGQWTKIHKPQLAGELPVTAQNRVFFNDSYKDWVSRFRREPGDLTLSLQEIRDGYAAEVFSALGTHLVGDEREISKTVFQGVNAAIKQVIGQGTVRNGEEFDKAPYHAVLRSLPVRRDICGFVRFMLVRKGFCPTLAAAFGITPESEAEDAEA